MKSTQVFLVGCVLGLAVAAPAWADDVLPPEWRGNHGTITAGWGYWGQPGLGPGTSVLFPGQIVANPGGFDPLQPVAYASWNSSVYVHDMLNGRQSVLEVSPGGGLGPVEFGLLNYDWPNPEKRIRIQITFQGTGVLDFYTYAGSGPPPVVPWSPTWPLTKIDAVVSESYAHPDGWQTNAYDLMLEPNPAWEVIYLDWGYTGPGGWTAFIDQVVIDTWCVPEPASASLFALVGLFALRCRRRRA